MSRSHLISTCGVSLLSNLKRASESDQRLRGLVEPATIDALKAMDPKAQDLEVPDDDAIGDLVRCLRGLPLGDRLLGAELNALSSLLETETVAENCHVHLLHTSTPGGRTVAAILTGVIASDSRTVEPVTVEGLDPSDPDCFARTGLRNLVRELSRLIRTYDASACAIDATGGFKAQVAVAVQVGQALEVPTYYRHEAFDRIIAFPPLPFSLDVRVWRRASWLYRSLADDPQPWADLLSPEESDQWETVFESLINRVWIDDVEYVELSPAGQILEEAFRSRRQPESALPEPASKQFPPRFEDAGWPGQHPMFERTLLALQEARPEIVRAQSRYYNPSLSRRSRAVISRGLLNVELCDRGATAKFILHTTGDDDQIALECLQEEINRWFAEQ